MAVGAPVLVVAENHQALWTDPGEAIQAFRKRFPAQPDRIAGQYQHVGTLRGLGRDETVELPTLMGRGQQIKMEITGCRDAHP
jgi:hypothetical protein